MEQQSEILSVTLPATLIKRITVYAQAVERPLDEIVGLALTAYLDMAAWSGRPHPLRAAREARQMSVQELANATGLQWRNIYRWESGTHIPEAEQANALAEVLGFASGDEIRRACTLWRVLQHGSSEPER